MRLEFFFSRLANTLTLMRKLGYSPDRHSRQKQMSFSRRLGSYTYPRFHIYIHKDSSSELVLNLHLDMKKPSYQGTAAHSGEYSGPTVEAEAARVKAFISDYKTGKL